MKMDIYIWGTGRLASVELGGRIDEKQITGFVDSNVTKRVFRGKRVYRPEEMLEKEYDAILVINIYAQEIYEQSIKLGLDIDKMIFVYNNYATVDINRNYMLAQKILGEEYSNVIQNRYLLVRRNEATEMLGKVLTEGYSDADYTRIKTFELVSEEIKKRNVQGAIAEVGVFRGEFAQYINAAFPEKTCYLFDTFEGFAEDEATEEVRSGHATQAMVEAYKNTNVDLVMDKMRYPEQVKVMKGLFPESLNGLEDKFAFVSVDVDFEKSIYDCLQYFYPRTVPGGTSLFMITTVFSEA